MKYLLCYGGLCVVIFAATTIEQAPESHVIEMPGPALLALCAGFLCQGIAMFWDD